MIVDDANVVPVIVNAYVHNDVPELNVKDGIGKFPDVNPGIKLTNL